MPFDGTGSSGPVRQGTAGMRTALKHVRHMLRLIGLAETVLAALILAGIVLMIIGQVALNAGLGNPLTWEQEAGAYALVWLTFVGASVALKQQRHVTIISFIGKLPVRLRRLARALVFTGIIWTLCIVMRELAPIMRIEARSTTIALPLDLPRSYFFSVPLMAASAMMLLTAALYLAEALAGIFDPDADSDVSPVLGKQ